MDVGNYHPPPTKQGRKAQEEEEGNQAESASNRKKGKISGSQEEEVGFIFRIIFLDILEEGFWGH